MSIWLMEVVYPIYDLLLKIQIHHIFSNNLFNYYIFIISFRPALFLLIIFKKTIFLKIIQDNIILFSPFYLSFFIISRPHRGSRIILFCRLANPHVITILELHVLTPERPIFQLASALSYRNIYGYLSKLHFTFHNVATFYLVILKRLKIGHT